jgi:hypothetical protein
MMMKKKKNKKKKDQKMMIIRSPRSASAHQIVVKGAPVPSVGVVVLLETFVLNTAKME